MTIKRAIMIFFILLAWILPLHAENDGEPGENPVPWYNEILSVSPLKLKKEDEKKWSVMIGGWYDQQRGNTDTSRSRGTLNYTYDTGLTYFGILSRVFYGTSGGEVNEHNGKATVRLDRYVHTRVELFLMAINEYDRMGGVAYRLNTGAGAKFVFTRNRILRTDISMAPVYQYENSMEGSNTRDVRASFRSRVSMRIWRATASVVYFYVPLVTDWSDYRGELNTSLMVKLADLGLTEKSGINLRADYIHKYNSQPPDDKKKWDDTLALQVILEF